MEIDEVKFIDFLKMEKIHLHFEDRKTIGHLQCFPPIPFIIRKKKAPIRSILMSAFQTSITLYSFTICTVLLILITPLEAFNKLETETEGLTEKRPPCNVNEPEL